MPGNFTLGQRNQMQLGSQTTAGFKVTSMLIAAIIRKLLESGVPLVLNPYVCVCVYMYMYIFIFYSIVLRLYVFIICIFYLFESSHKAARVYIVLTKHLNQDPLEQLFGHIRVCQMITHCSRSPPYHKYYPDGENTGTCKCT